MTCRRCYVSGRVQGVAFRDAVRARAREFELDGYARNLADGRVEVLVHGKLAGVDSLCAWLWQGPPQAQVSDVTCMDVELEPPRGFTIE